MADCDCNLVADCCSLGADCCSLGADCCNDTDICCSGDCCSGDCCSGDCCSGDCCGAGDDGGCDCCCLNSCCLICWTDVNHAGSLTSPPTTNQVISQQPNRRNDQNGDTACEQHNGHTEIFGPAHHDQVVLSNGHDLPPGAPPTYSEAVNM